MTVRLAGSILGIAAVLGPVAIDAQGALNYYTAPKIKVRGKSTSPIAGAGTVVVKVFVKKDGTASQFSVVRSSNHGDDAAALEIAKNSSYKAATKGPKPMDAFYDYTLRFTSAGTVSNSEPPGSLASYKLMISGGNYSGAASGLKSYLQGHPGDQEAEAQLGIAEEFLNHPSEAAAAFDAAGTLPANYQSVAVRAYNDAANAAFTAKDFAVAVGYAKKSVALTPGPFQYNTLGTAEDAAGQNDAAVTDLVKARDLANADPKFKPEEKAKIDVNLISAYLDAGKMDQARPLVDEVSKLDPTNQNAKAFFANYYSKQADAAAKAQKFADAAAFFEQAAGVAPASQVAALYDAAAQMYLKISPNTPADKAKADADKALAADPDNALANFLAGVALADQGKKTDALTYLNKADLLAKAAKNADLASAVEAIIKQLGGTH